MRCRSSDFGCHRLRPPAALSGKVSGDANMSSGQGQGDVWALGRIRCLFRYDRLAGGYGTGVVQPAKKEERENMGDD